MKSSLREGNGNGLEEDNNNFLNNLFRCTFRKKKKKKTKDPQVSFGKHRRFSSSNVFSEATVSPSHDDEGQRMDRSMAESELMVSGPSDTLFLDRLERGNKVYEILREAKLMDYAVNFYAEKVNYHSLHLIDEEMLKDLIPEPIPRNRFLKYLLEFYKIDVKSKMELPPIKQERVVDLTAVKDQDKKLDEKYTRLVIVNELIGKGSYGVVMRGNLVDEDNIKVDVAVKEFKISKDENSDMFVNILEESEIHSRLKYPYIIRHYGLVFERDSTDRINNAIIVLEYCQKGNLTQNIRFFDTPSKKIKALHQISCGIDFLHKREIIHRDLKPKNILVSKGWDLKISDFGTAKSISKTGNSFVGTVDFIDPQYQLGEKTVYKTSDDKKKLDVYAFGILGYKVWTKNDPFPKLNELHEYAKLQKIYKENLMPPLEEIEIVEVRNIIESCLKKKISDRPTFNQIRASFKKLKDDYKNDDIGSIGKTKKNIIIIEPQEEKCFKKVEESCSIKKDSGEIEIIENFPTEKLGIITKKREVENNKLDYIMK